jgi:hypothetical protein
MYFFAEFLEITLNTKGLDWVKDQGILVTHNPDYPNLYCLKYGPRAVKNSTLTKACRGTVVEEIEGNFKVVCYGLTRFFNLDEPDTPTGIQFFDWESFVAYEKYDGSLIKLFNYNSNWLISTSGTIEGEINQIGASEVFWKTFNLMDYSTKDLDPSVIYVWELCTKETANVVTYSEDFLSLIAVRSRVNFEELYLENFSKKFSVAQQFSFSSQENVIKFANSRRGSKSEGLVLKDWLGNRLKVKSKEYVKFHLLLNNKLPDLFLIWKLGELDEFLTYFPQYIPEADLLLSQIYPMEKEVENFVKENSFLEQKGFAEKAIKKFGKFSGAAFAIRSRKERSFQDWLRNKCRTNPF